MSTERQRATRDLAFTLPGGIVVRPIRPTDDQAVAQIIRTVMPEFSCSGAGFALHDAEVDGMSAAYAGPAAEYHVLELDGHVQGGGGFGPLAGSSPADATCELRKMYFLPTLRGRGAGRALLDFLLQRMRVAGFRSVYLETTTQMEAARRLYLAAGFREIPAALGATGHHGCDRFFVREL